MNIYIFATYSFISFLYTKNKTKDMTTQKEESKIFKIFFKGGKAGGKGLIYSKIQFNFNSI